MLGRAFAASGEEGAPRSPGVGRGLTPAIALAAIVLAGAVALAWHPWQHGKPVSTPTSSSQPPAAATISAEPAGSDVVTAVAVDASGQPANGYREAPAGSSIQLADCDGPSPAAVSKNIYSCYPTAAGADVCWPSPPTSMLCMNNPWDKEVGRLSYDTRLLTPVQPPTTPEPFALTLDNGTHCQLITGGARRARSDGYVPFYACGADLTAYVLGDAGSQTDPVNRSKPSWTVTFEQPGFQTQVQSVTTAWFAGT